MSLAFRRGRGQGFLSRQRLALLAEFQIDRTRISGAPKQWVAWLDLLTNKGTMKRADLEAVVFTEVNVSAALWAAAAILACARSASNEGRAPEHDRGIEGNRQVDLHGAFGELLLQRTLRQIANSEDAQQYMSTSMFIATGGGWARKSS